MAATIVWNVSGAPVSLRLPYNAILPPGKGVVVSEAPSTVLSNLGGADAVNGILRLEDASNIVGLAQSDVIPAKATFGFPAHGYTSPHQEWFEIDGVNPPRVAALRFVDQVTGATRTVTVQGGVLTVS